MENQERRFLLSRIKWLQVFAQFLALITVVRSSEFTLTSSNKYQNLWSMVIAASLIGFILRTVFYMYRDKLLKIDIDKQSIQQSEERYRQNRSIENAEIVK